MVIYPSKIFQAIILIFLMQRAKLFYLVEKLQKNFFEKQKLKARFKKNKKHFSMVKRGIKLFNSEGLIYCSINLCSR